MKKTNTGYEPTTNTKHSFHHSVSFQRHLMANTEEDHIKVSQESFKRFVTRILKLYQINFTTGTVVKVNVIFSIKYS